MNQKYVAFCHSFALCCSASSKANVATRTNERKPSTCSRRYRYWNAANLERELRNFAQAQNASHRMPTQQEVVRAGRHDLAGAVKRNGGWVKTAKDLEWKSSSIARPRSLYLTFCMEPKTSFMKPFRYWNSFENIRKEVEAYVKERSMNEDSDGASVYFPTAKELRDNGKTGLLRAIYKHGGAGAVALKLGMKTRNHCANYWKDFKHVEEELERIALLSGDDGFRKRVFPSTSFLQKVASKGLQNAIKMHGGRMEVCKRAGMVLDKAPNKYWVENNYEKLRKEIMSIVEASGMKTMPTRKMLAKENRTDLLNACARLGGVKAVAKLLHLPYSRKRRVLWQETSPANDDVVKSVKR
eukprot:Plantae.Rhodophyta-Hildenbrandia_rubra.ctg57646.p1 GENE.Plantae.Rhodophyta-Hildenbrandia_rubra.ctg57646~~Plantae.Rhodophyta-Hildenbrandia_rubra.ctg57646.p1  ORF type:complete len:355 (+),score=50.91 Plantae.Rhodophyta-Hildenbrandia_rubra.ctg57646:218-1282(+)